MNENIRNTWDNYTLSWKAGTAIEKNALFEKCLTSACEYNDPNVNIQGRDALLNYMLEFHKNIPGGHFVTTYFLTHSNKSIARWDLIDGSNMVLRDGISYCEYNNTGLLVSMTGFFATE